MRPFSGTFRIDGVLLTEIDVADPPSTEDLQALLRYADGYLPPAYLDVIRQFDGVSGWFGGPEAPEHGYLTLDSCRQVLDTCRAYGLPDEGSTFLPVGGDGGGMFYGYDFGTREWVYVDMVCVGFREDEMGRYPTLRAMFEDVLRRRGDR